jgi:DNA-binding response OmpR family regulator
MPEIECTGRHGSMRILLVADLNNVQLLELAVALDRRGAVTFHIPPVQVTRAVMEERDFILLDPGLPYHESIGLCDEVRAMSDIPIMMISNRTERADRIRALQAGADDYVTCPYDLREVIARIIAVTRPRGRRRDEEPRRSYDFLDDMQIDPERMRVTVSGAITELTKKEFQMLTLIAGAEGAVCPREKLAIAVWGRPEEEVSDSIHVLMSRLRSKIGQGRIETVRSVGYQLIDAAATGGRDRVGHIL